MTLYLILEKKGSKWIPRGNHLFNDEESAWEWADKHYPRDDQRLRLYLVDINLSGFPVFDKDHNVVETIP